MCNSDLISRLSKFPADSIYKTVSADKTVKQSVSVWSKVWHPRVAVYRTQKDHISMLKDHVESCQRSMDYKRKYSEITSACAKSVTLQILRLPKSARKSVFSPLKRSWGPVWELILSAVTTVSSSRESHRWKINDLAVECRGQTAISNVTVPDFADRKLGHILLRSKNIKCLKERYFSRQNTTCEFSG